MMSKLFGTLAVLGFLFQLGTVGALENDVISMGQSLMQLAIGGAVLFAGLKGSRAL